jgi:hypothetical protein
MMLTRTSKALHVSWTLLLAGSLAACGEDAVAAAPDDAGDMSTVPDAQRNPDAELSADAQVVPDAHPGVTDASSAADGGGSQMDADASQAEGDASMGSAPSWLIESGDSVFFVGNSFFGWEDRRLAEWVAAVGQSVSPPVTINTGSHVVFGNNPLSWFFAEQESQDAIDSGNYDVFVLQGEEFEPVDHKEEFHAAVRDYHAAVTQHGGRVMLFMTWDFVWNDGNPQFFDALSASYDEIGAELGIPVIPVGLIYQDVDADLPPGEQKYFLTGQNLHQTESGSAVNAYATFAMLTGRNPMGVTFTANGNTNSPELLAYLSDKSWARVMTRLHD